MKLSSFLKYFLLPLITSLRTFYIPVANGNIECYTLVISRKVIDIPHVSKIGSYLCFQEVILLKLAVSGRNRALNPIPPRKAKTRYRMVNRLSIIPVNQNVDGKSATKSIYV
jgi:hypothetical protein